MSQHVHDATASSTESPMFGLSVENAGKKFGPIRVLEDVSFEVRLGEVLALLGENGAGKSTISNIIAGVITPTEGKMSWQGKEYAPTSPREALDAGIGLIHQEIRLLPDLSVAENIFVGHQLMRAGRIDTIKMEQLAGEQLDRLGLDIAPQTMVRNLRVAAQQQVEIAKALTLNAKLLILDEPTTALGGKEVDRLFQQIENLKAQGVAFIYISHRLEEIARIADRISVLRDGRLICTHESGKTPVKTLVTDMVGRQVDRMFPKRTVNVGQEVIRIENLTSSEGKFRNVNFAVNSGEIFGISGIVGAGRTELVRAIYGADPIESGNIYLEGKKVHLTSPKNALDQGIVLVPEDRKDQGLIVDHLIGDNVVYGNFDLATKGGWCFPKKISHFATKTIEKLGVKGRIEQPTSSLSGGNQQKVVVAKWIARNPKVFILDEPTRGIDVGARAFIYQIIADLAKKGMAVIVVSSDLEEVLGISDRILVLAHGDPQGILTAEKANQISVMELATR